MKKPQKVVDTLPQMWYYIGVRNRGENTKEDDMKDWQIKKAEEYKAMDLNGGLKMALT